MSPTCFLFDIGNVLIDWNPDYLLQKLLPDAAAVAAFRANGVTDARNLNMDRGQDWASLLAEIARDAPQHLETAKIYGDRWIETISGPIQASVDLMQSLLQEGYPVYALSNFGVENFEATVRHYPFLNDFTGRVVSGYEGVIKPDPAIYHLAIQRFGLIPKETLFIDDRAENIEAASALGFQTHHFSDSEILQTLLSP